MSLTVRERHGLRLVPKVRISSGYTGPQLDRCIRNFQRPEAIEVFSKPSSGDTWVAIACILAVLVGIVQMVGAFMGWL